MSEPSDVVSCVLPEELSARTRFKRETGVGQLVCHTYNDKSAEPVDASDPYYYGPYEFGCGTSDL